MKKLFIMKLVEKGSVKMNGARERFNNKPFWYRFKIFFRVEVIFLEHLGVFNYLKRKLWS